jgi:hypothetical protein
VALTKPVAGEVRGKGVSMRLVILGAAFVLAATGVAIGKDKKVIVGETASCSANHLSIKANSKRTPKLDCKSTGTIVQPADSKANALEPRSGFLSDPWI